MNIEERKRLKRKYYATVPRPSETFDNEILSNIKNNFTLLDAGCGSELKTLVKISGNIKYAVGVDMCRKFKKYDKIKAISADLSHIPFKANSFDIVVCRSVTEHLTNPVDFLKECSRILKSGGKLIILCPNKWDYVSVFSALTPNCFHTIFLKKIAFANLEGQKRGYENFSTYFLLNTRGAFYKKAKGTDLVVKKIIAVRNNPIYLMWSKLTYYVGVIYDRLITKLNLDWLQPNWLVVYEKTISK